jgi:SAM-dependent methyltransferase
MSAPGSCAELSIIWHDLECGGYAEDLDLWRRLATAHGSPILDVGAGTGRVALDLARRGHSVTAIDNDETLARELARRAGDLDVHVVIDDARTFELDQQFALCLVPMQTIQLLSGVQGRAQFLRSANRHLLRGGLLAVAIAQTLDLYDITNEAMAPMPDICEVDGVVYSSQPTAVRVDANGFTLERRREVVGSDGERSVTGDVIRLDGVRTAELEREGEAAGFRPVAVESILPTRDYAGSEVVILGV